MIKVHPGTREGKNHWRLVLRVRELCKGCKSIGHQVALSTNEKIFLTDSAPVELIRFPDSECLIPRKKIVRDDFKACHNNFCPLRIRLVMGVGRDVVLER